MIWADQTIALTLLVESPFVECLRQRPIDGGWEPHMADLTRRGPDVAGSEPVRGSLTDEWAPVSRVRTYELVLERIEAQIVSGSLRAGERLPPERELAELLGVSRPAVREALRVLESQGAVRSQAVSYTHLT